MDKNFKSQEDIFQEGSRDLCDEEIYGRMETINEPHRTEVIMIERGI